MGLVIDDITIKWRPANVEEVERIVQQDLLACDAAQVSAFKQYAVTPYHAPITRYGRNESVIVIARREYEAIYWEDVEEGFNISTLGSQGEILEHSCNQDRLGLAVNAWIETRKRPTRIGPAIPIDH
jgi:hypothetical protein